MREACIGALDAPRPLGSDEALGSGPDGRHEFAPCGGVEIVVHNTEPSPACSANVSEDLVLGLLNELHVHQIRRQAEDDVAPFWDAARAHLSARASSAEDIEARKVPADVYARARRALAWVLERRRLGELPAVASKTKLSREKWLAAFGVAADGPPVAAVARPKPSDPTTGPLTLIGPAELLKVPPPPRWLIDDLWVGEGVGIIGAAPKSYKTWIAVEMALAVASGTRCFGRFNVPEPGPVIAFFAEDSLAAIRQRMLAVCEARGLELERLPIQLVASSVLRLDCLTDQERLRNAVEQTRPRLVVLDPLVRLHGGDENDSGHIGRLLGFLRTLQRDCGTSILLTHHNRKTHSSSAPEGQGLRGSGDLHAWTDSGLFLRRRNGVVTLRVEHRSAASPEPMRVTLAQDPVPHIQMSPIDDADDETVALQNAESLETRAHRAIASSPSPMTRSALRAALRCRNQSLATALRALVARGSVLEVDGGWATGKAADVIEPPSAGTG